MKRFWLIVLMSALIIPLFAQENDESDRNWYLNKKILDIKFTGLDMVSENELRSVTKEFIGEEFTDTISWEMQARLYALEYFEMVLANISPGDGAKKTVVVTFDVKEKPSVNVVKFVGNDRIRKSELRDVILVVKGDILNNSSLRMDKDAIGALYLEKGFLDAEVELRTEVNEEENTANVFFEITEGIQTKISDIYISGYEGDVTEKNISGLMDTKVQTLFNRGLFVESVLQEDLASIRTFYQSRGYIDMDFNDVSRDIALDEEDGINKMIISIDINQGVQYKFGSITFEGNSIYTDEELGDYFSLLTPGSTLNMLNFERAFQRINDAYYENGYIYNMIDYKMDKNEQKGEVDFTVTVVERDRAHIESISIRGNDRTKDYVIMREMELEPGDVFNRSKLLEGWQNLMSTQYFSSVEPQTYQGSTDGLMDLVLDVEEGKTANILFGMTFSGGPDFPISGQISWSDSNVGGTGKTVGVSSQFSFDEQSVSLNYKEPWLFGVRWSGGFDLTYKHDSNNLADQDIDGNGLPDPFLTQDEYDQSTTLKTTDNKMNYTNHSVSTGFSTGYTWVTPVGKFSAQTSIREGLDYIVYDEDLYKPYSSTISDNLNTWTQSDSLTFKVVLDDRDISYDPNKGYLLSQAFTIAGITPTSTDQYFKTVSKIGLYATLFDIPSKTSDNSFKCVLNLDSAFSYIFEKDWLTDYELDLSSEGYYVDGMFIARGWSVETGGKALWDNTFAIKFPVVPQVLSFDFFLDAVGMWSTDFALENMSLADYRFSMGVGARFANPSFPIGIYLVKKFSVDEDNSINWNPEPDYVEFEDTNMDLVVAFEIDIY